MFNLLLLTASSMFEIEVSLSHPQRSGRAGCESAVGCQGKSGATAPSSSYRPEYVRGD